MAVSPDLREPAVLEHDHAWRLHRITDEDAPVVREYRCDLCSAVFRL